LTNSAPFVSFNELSIVRDAARICSLFVSSSYMGMSNGLTRKPAFHSMLGPSWHPPPLASACPPRP
jgi:hypothetical protein